MQVVGPSCSMVTPKRIHVAVITLRLCQRVWRNRLCNEIGRLRPFVVARCSASVTTEKIIGTERRPNGRTLAMRSSSFHNMPSQPVNWAYWYIPIGLFYIYLCLAQTLSLKAQDAFHYCISEYV